MDEMIKYEDKIIEYENSKFDDGDIVVDDVAVTYTQNNDCTEKEGCQVLYVEARNNGVARFIAISTDKKNWWSIDDINSLVILLEDFKHRSGLDNVKFDKEK